MMMKGYPRLESVIEQIENLNTMFNNLNVRHEDLGKNHGKNDIHHFFAGLSFVDLTKSLQC